MALPSGVAPAISQMTSGSCFTIARLLTLSALNREPRKHSSNVSKSYSSKTLLWHGYWLSLLVGVGLIQYIWRAFGQSHSFIYSSFSKEVLCHLSVSHNLLEAMHASVNKADKKLCPFEADSLVSGAGRWRGRQVYLGEENKLIKM